MQEISEQVEKLRRWPFWVSPKCCRYYDGPKGQWWMGPEHSEFGPQNQSDDVVVIVVEVVEVEVVIEMEQRRSV